MREILFKAKRKNWKKLPKEKWRIEGAVLQSDNRAYIATSFVSGAEDEPLMVAAYEVIPETICQYTGLTDKNGTVIWENDIVEVAGEDGYFKCEWDEDTARFALNGDGLMVDFDNYWSYQVEVVGNIFDNAELLEVE